MALDGPVDRLPEGGFPQAAADPERAPDHIDRQTRVPSGCLQIPLLLEVQRVNSVPVNRHRWLLPESRMKTRGDSDPRNRLPNRFRAKENGEWNGPFESRRNPGQEPGCSQ